MLHNLPLNITQLVIYLHINVKRSRLLFLLKVTNFDGLRPSLATCRGRFLSCYCDRPANNY